LGNYSKQHLMRAGVYDELSSKVLPVDNSRAVLAAISSGAAASGIAFASDAQRARELKLLYRIHADDAAATYEAALIGRKKPSLDAKQLLAFLSSPTAAKCLRRCGLKPLR
jgi:molybdate transport system substrate-binding protein